MTLAWAERVHPCCAFKKLLVKALEDWGSSQVVREGVCISNFTAVLNAGMKWVLILALYLGL